MGACVASLLHCSQKHIGAGGCSDGAAFLAGGARKLHMMMRMLDNDGLQGRILVTVCKIYSVNLLPTPKSTPAGTAFCPCVFAGGL